MLYSAIHNPRVSERAKRHAQQELDQVESQGPGSEDRHEGNVKRGLKAYALHSFSFPRHMGDLATDGLTRATHNPNVTDYGKQEARSKLESMGEEVEEPSD